MVVRKLEARKNRNGRWRAYESDNQALRTAWQRGMVLRYANDRIIEADNPEELFRLLDREGYIGPHTHQYQDMEVNQE